MERISFDRRWKPGRPGFHQAAMPLRQIVVRAVDGGNFDLKKKIRDYRSPSSGFFALPLGASNKTTGVV